MFSRRGNEKIKDFVEPQSFEELQDFTKDPALTLSSYHFTDATSDLLARWLDTLADLPRGKGTARALAGLRGVGKSHTLAVFGTIAGYPQLRQSIQNQHVATSARRLLGRKNVVAFVERGSRETLLQEMGSALSVALGDSQAEYASTLETLLSYAASRITDGTLVLIIDQKPKTTLSSDRDDSELLALLAAVAPHVNCMIALAMDDNLGPALSANYNIDYLDTEHIYRVTDQYLLRKNAKERTRLHQMYMDLRQKVPSFNWSEPRFTSLYPVHPLIADIAPAVRHHAPSFSFFPFVVDSSLKALSRPALSLVVLDEVFDRTENDLRSSAELKDAFSVFDHLASNSIQQFSVMQRLQAKLVLKGLFILSLDGRGATAKELCGAMLFHDDAGPDATALRIQEVLEIFFTDAAPGFIQKSSDGTDIRYRLNIASSARLESAIAERLASLPEGSISFNSALAMSAKSRFEDWPLKNLEQNASADSVFEWRGTDRLGKVYWIESTPDASQFINSTYDWQLLVLAPGVSIQNIPGHPGLALWRPAEITTEEAEILRRLVTLNSYRDFYIEYGESAGVVERSLKANAERIWTRLYLEQGTFITGETGLYFTADSRSSSLLSEALSVMFSPLMEARYPEHPQFTRELNESVAEVIVKGLAGKNEREATNYRDLSEYFLSELGVAGLDRKPAPWIGLIETMLQDSAGSPVPFETICSVLRNEPFGLSRESQHIILASLVEQRKVVLITSEGSVIGRKELSPDIWLNVSAIKLTGSTAQSIEDLTVWAQLLTGIDPLPSLTEPVAVEEVRTALLEWLNDWTQKDILTRLEDLPDEGLTTKASNNIQMIKKSFGTVASELQNVIEQQITLEEGLQRVSDAFGGDVDTYHDHRRILMAVSDFGKELQLRLQARDYLIMADPTEADDLESARRELLGIAVDPHSVLDVESRSRFDRLWKEFHSRYTVHYSTLHDLTVGPEALYRDIDEYLCGDEWREFEALSRALAPFRTDFWLKAEDLVSTIESARCDLRVRAIVQEQPFCVCSFRLTRSENMLESRHKLYSIVSRALSEYRKLLLNSAERLKAGLSEIPQSPPRDALISYFSRQSLPDHLSIREIRLVQKALELTGKAQPVASLR
jgi:hypothetical protein